MNLNSIQLRQHVPCCALNVTGHTSLPVYRQRGHYSRLHGLPSSGLDQLAASTVSRHRRREHRPGCVCQAASSKQTVAITGTTPTSCCVCIPCDLPELCGYLNRLGVQLTSSAGLLWLRLSSHLLSLGSTLMCGMQVQRG